MARSRTRGRHIRRTTLREWLAPGLRRRDRASEVVALPVDVRALEDEVARLRQVEVTSTALAVAIELRLERTERELAAARHEVVGLRAEAGSLRAEAQGLRTQVTDLRAELAALREELAWAFAERRLPVEVAETSAVSDLTVPRAASA